MSKYGEHLILYLLIYTIYLFKIAENSDCVSKSLKGREKVPVQLENECSIFFYEDESISSTSISRIIAEVVPEDNTSSYASTRIVIEEYKVQEERYIKVEAWTINSNETFNKSHYSQNSKVKITFNTTGIWTKSEISLRYEEIEFEHFTCNVSCVSTNEITPWVKFEERHYRPNSQYTFIVDKNESLSSSGLLITLNELDMDKERGEYLLIGPGSTPFEGPRPICITEPGPKKYYVDDGAAYIIFSTNATRKDYLGFNISWNYEGTEIKIKPDIDENDAMKKSAPICIYNVSAIEEVETSEDIFQEFREKFAEVATDYRNTNNSVIDASSVSVFGISRKNFKDNESQLARHARVKITDDSVKGKAAFSYHELREIISIYSEKASSGQIKDIFMFRKCKPHFVPESWFYFGLILMIPVICFALLLWIWKQNPIAEHYEKKRRLKRASQHENSKYYADNCDFGVQAADGNPYTTLPKVQITNVHGRRTTVNLSDTLLCDDNASDDELFNKLYTNKRPSDVIELQRMRRTNRLFLTNEGEDNAAFELNEDSNSIQGQKQHEDRGEHTYESVKSSASFCENTKL